MKKISVLLIFCFSLAFYEAKAYEVCDGVKAEPKINFFTSYGRLIYDFSQSKQQITRLGAQMGHKESSSFASGLALIVVENEYQVGASAKFSFRGHFCVVPKEINVYVGFAKPRILISKDLQKNTCEYNLVMLHEQTHHQINRKVLEYFLPHLQHSAEIIGSELPVLKIKNLSELPAATETLSGIFDARFNKVLEVFKKELAIEQGKLDNRGNYILEGDICKNFNAKRFHH